MLKGNLGKPWSTDDKRIQSLPKKGKDLWVRVANAYIEEHGDSEDNAVSAIRIAWAAVHRAGYNKAEGAHKWAEPTAEGLAAFEKELHPFGGAPVSFVKAVTREGKRYVTVKASGLKVDRQGERMDKTAIDDMVEACMKGEVELLDNHFSSFEMGKSVGATVNEDGEMFVEFLLNDEHPNNDQLYKECEEGTCKRQASVGGNVTKARYEYNDAMGIAVKVLEHVKLDHVAVTRGGHSAYPDAEFTGAICKQVHLPDFVRKGGENMKEKLIKALEGLAAEANTYLKSLFTLTPDMLDEKHALKAEFIEQMTKGVKVEKLSDEERTRVAKSLEPILKSLGVPVVFKQGDEAPVAAPISEVMKSFLAVCGKLSKTLEGSTDEEKALAKEFKDGLEKVETTSVAAERPKGKKGEEHGSENGSVEATKAIIEAMKKDLETRLEAQSKAHAELLKDSHASKAELTKSMLEVAELKKELAKVSALPSAPRPGVATPISKEVTSTELNPGNELQKDGVDPLAYMKSVQLDVERLVKLKGTRSWNAELAKEAEQKAAILKECITAGPLATMQKYAPKATA